MRSQRIPLWTFALFLAAMPATRAAAQSASTCTVTRVVDGDTIHCGGERVRLLMIDAPEEAQGPLGRAAQAFLEAILPVGSKATLELDVERRDRYERLLAYVYRHDGRMVNEMMARQGFAVALVIPPNVRHVETIRAAVEGAKAARVGLWSIDAFECAPRDSRRGLCSEPAGAAAPTPDAGAHLAREGCDPSYPDVCIPPPPPDLDCRDIPYRRFRVIGADSHRLDGNRDGVGCEGR